MNGAAAAMDICTFVYLRALGPRISCARSGAGDDKYVY